MLGKLTAVLAATGLVLALSATGAMAATSATNTPAQVKKTTLGKVLATPKGYTLYVNSKDPLNNSKCTGKCAKAWPPFLASNSATPNGNYTLITRKDGSQQWAFEHKPLYTWKGDKKPGDVSGNGFKGTWYVARPS